MLYNISVWGSLLVTVLLSLQAGPGKLPAPQQCPSAPRAGVCSGSKAAIFFPVAHEFLISFGRQVILHWLKVLSTKAKLWFISRLYSSRLYFYAYIKNGVTTENLHVLLRVFPTAGDGGETTPCLSNNETASISLPQKNQQHI